MTTTADAKPVTRGTSPTAAQPLAGFRTLVRFILRRDRIKLPAWVAGISLLAVYLVTVVESVLADPRQQDDVRRFMEGGIGAVFGPGYGRDDVTPDVYVAGVYGMIFFILTAIMTFQLVVRHTRLEEQSGRSELVRSNVVGRHATLTAALTVAVGANLALALLLAMALTLTGYGPGDGLLFGASVAAVGVVFAGVTALTVQVTVHSRAAAGLAGAVLGIAWAVRAAGDMLQDFGSPLSWLSPLAWSNQTRPYVDARWWPLLLSLALASGTAALGLLLSGRRDVGAGLVAARTGPPNAASWLASPVALVFRLQRASLAWWTVALAAFGLSFGAFTAQVTDVEGISQDRIDMFGGSVDTLADGYLGIVTLLTASLAGIVAFQGVQAARAAEAKGTAEPVLATATSRSAWLGSHLVVTSIGVTALLLIVGCATGIGAALSLGDGTYVATMTAAHLAHAPGLLALAGFTAAMLGVAPKAIGLTWGLLSLGLFNGLFGSLAELPLWLRSLLVTDHLGQPPLEPVSWTATGVLLAAALLLGAVGLVGFRSRDLDVR
jgi:ABC-2 type transport system permease protein